MQRAVADGPEARGRRDADRADEAARDQKPPTHVEATEGDSMLEEAEREAVKYVPL
jgi:hypothetical protein